MATAVLECSVCKSSFDTSEHKPLCLLCGHTFCLVCVKRIETSKGRQCYVCKKPMSVSASELPVNHALTPSETKPQVNKCATHRCELKYWCVDCGTALCKKCTSKGRHSRHHFELIDEFLDKIENAPEVKENVCSQLKGQLDCISSYGAAQEEVLQLIKKAKSVEAKISQERDLLVSKRDALVRDLEIWDGRGKMPASDEEKRQCFRGIVARLKDLDTRPEREDQELEELKARMLELNEYMAALELKVDLPQALSSSASRKKSPRHPRRTGRAAGLAQQNEETEYSGPKSPNIKVVSTPADPIRRLQELLMGLGNACTGVMHVVPLDYFYGLQGARKRNLLPFIEKHGDKLQTFFGSPAELAAVCRVGRPQLTGVRLSKLNDIERAASLAVRPHHVSCLRSLPATAGELMLQLGWAPSYWHTPDLQDDDLEWLHSVAKPCTLVCRPELFLPRCHLSPEGVRRLLDKQWGRGSPRLILVFENDYGESKPQLEALARQNNAEVKFKGCKDWVF